MKVKYATCFIALMLPNFSLAQCYDSSIQTPTPFMGNHDEVFKLTDESLWKVNSAYEYMYEYHPNITICPANNFMLINGKKIDLIPLSTATTKKTTKHSGYLESRISGDFNGFDGQTIFKLTNGQIWQQSEYWYHYHYAYSPAVLIYSDNGQYKIKVDGIDKSIGIHRLK